MEYNLTYDYCSIILLACLLFFYFVTPKYKSFQNRLFGWILICNLVSAAMDALSAGVLIPKYPDEILINRLVLCLYQLGQHALSPLYYIYMVLIVYGDKAKEHLKKFWFLLIPGVAVEVLNLLSPFTQWGFIYDENGYSRTWAYFLFWGVLAFYMILCLILIFIFRTKTGFLPKIAVLFYTVGTLAAAILQYMFPSQLVINFAACVTIFSMYLALQNPTLLKEALEDAERSKREAQEANEAKSNFLANMSHEIRTPMNAICGMTYLLESFDLKTDARDYVSTIQSASENLLSLINGILDYSKVDAGQMTLQETEYRTDALIREIDGMILSELPEDRIAASLYVAPDVPKTLRGDVTKVKQIILNLLSNAIKFTENGEVRLEIYSQPKENGNTELKICVKDTGIGIREEDLGKIFAQFEQLDMAKNRKRDGTGLGLALVKGYCELMNGRIEVESTYGSGSSFTAFIEQEAVNGFEEEKKERLKDFVYVVLEKNPYVRRSIEKTLTSIQATYTVEEYYSKDAFEKFPGMDFCLIYDNSSFGAEVAAVDVKDIKGLLKLAMVDFGEMIPEDCKDVQYVRKPFSLFTLFDNVSAVKVEVKAPEEEEVFFKNSVKVAIVDDNKVNLKVTGAILKKFGISASAMLSGYEILDEMDAGAQYDLIFMDHMMPDMDGVETVKRIRSLHKGNSGSVPIVALTANAVEGAEKEYYEAGMNGALFKPVNVEDLKKTLIKWLPASSRIDPPKQ